MLLSSKVDNNVKTQTDRGGELVYQHNCSVHHGRHSVGSWSTEGSGVGECEDAFCLVILALLAVMSRIYY